VSDAFIGSPFVGMAVSVPRPEAGYARVMPDMREDPAETEAAELEVDQEAAYKEGDEVWVQDADGKDHPGVFVGMNEAAGWFGGGASAYVVHAEGHQAEVVSLARITRRD
jgi:hypothetical protein